MRKTPLFATGVFLIFASFQIFRWTRNGGAPTWGRGDAFLLFLGLAASLAEARSRLPWQNIVAVCWLAGALGGGGEILFRLKGFAGLREVAAREWVYPLVWIVTLLNARAFCRVFLKEWRSDPWYGVWLAGWSGLMAAVCLSAFAFLCRQALAMPPVVAEIVLRLIAAWVLLVVCAPFLIPKRPFEVSEVPAIVNWLALNLLLCAIAELRGAWGWMVGLITANALVALAGIARKSSTKRFL